MKMMIKKRIMFPWISSNEGRLYKCALALIAEKEGFGDVISGKIKISKLFKRVISLANSKFPSMYQIVKKHYLKGGREINEKEFNKIVFARLQFMFYFDKVKKEINRLQEHPYNDSKLGTSVEQAKQLIK